VVDNLCGRPQDFFAQYSAVAKINDLVDLYTVFLQKSVGQKYTPEQAGSELAARAVPQGGQAAVLKVRPGVEFRFRTLIYAQFLLIDPNWEIG
jgi:hypothetical protein